MKLNGLAVLAIASALFAAAAPARAENGVIPRLAIELDTGAVFVGEPGFGRGWRYGGGVFIRTGLRMGVEVLLESYDVPVDSGVDGLPVAGRMRMTSLLINEQFYILTHGRVLPYALVGIGLTDLGYRYDPDLWPSDRTPRVFVDRLALQVGAGVDVRVSSRLALCGRARYNLVKTWMEDAGRTAPIRETDPLAQNMLHLYGLELGFGIKLGF